MTGYPNRFVLAVDRSKESDHACEVAGRLSAATGSAVHIIHVKTTSSLIHGDVVTEADRDRVEQEGQELLEERRERVEQTGGTVADTRVVVGQRIDETVVHTVAEQDADLLVIGGRGESELTRLLLLGDTAASIVRHAPCSVLVARRPPGESG